MKGFSAAGLALGVLLVGLLAFQAECVTFILGGKGVGWNNKANIDYTKSLSTFNVKIGDTLKFENWDDIEHSYTVVNKLAYDTCGRQGEMYLSRSIAPGYYEPQLLLQSGPFYAICTISTHCLQGMKVYTDVLNADGTRNTTATKSGSPTANSAFALSGSSWASQLFIATVAVMVAVIPILAY